MPSLWLYSPVSNSLSYPAIYLLASLKYALSCWNVAANGKTCDAVKDAPFPFFSPASFLHITPTPPRPSSFLSFSVVSLPLLSSPLILHSSLSGSAATEGLFQRNVATAETSSHGSYNSEWIVMPGGQWFVYIMAGRWDQNDQ